MIKMFFSPHPVNNSNESIMGKDKVNLNDIHKITILTIKNALKNVLIFNLTMQNSDSITEKKILGSFE